MAKQVKFRRGTTADHSVFTGAVGELTVDTDKKVVIVHDGGTVGGRPMAREDLSNVSEIAVSKLANGTARQLLQTAANGLDVEWSNDIEIPGSLYVAGPLVLEGTTADPNEVTIACDPSADRTVTLPDATTTLAGLGVVQTFTVAQRGTVSAQGSVSGTVTLDFAVANNFSMSLPVGSDVTLANPSNLTAGQSGAIVITQNATTASTVSYGGYWKFSGGTPTMSTGLSSVSTLVYFVESTTRITAQLLTNVA